MKEETKLVKSGGGPGQNVAKVTRQTYEKSEFDLAQRGALKELKRIGDKLAPYGSRYLGSASIHYYAEDDSGGTKPVFKTVVQISLDGVVEGLADFGHKRLQEDMMNYYGKVQPKIRQDLVLPK